MSSAGAVAGADVHRLTSYLETRRPGLVNGELSIELVPGGRSNLRSAWSVSCTATTPRPSGR